MDVGRRHETPGPKTKDFITHGIAGSMNFTVKSVSLKLPTGMWGWAQVILHVLRNSELRRSQTFTMSCKQTCPTFAPDVVRFIIISILDSE